MIMVINPFWAGFSIFILFIFLAYIYQALPYVPSKPETVEKMVKIAAVRKGEKAVDLGSGDGRVVIALAKAGAQAHGFETNLWLVFKSRSNIRKAGLEKKAFIHWKNFWNQNLSSFNIVTFYGITYVMKKMEKKLQRELKEGTRVVVNSYTFPNWQYEKQVDNVYLYKKN